jgi:hypothetical protein
MQVSKKMSALKGKFDLLPLSDSTHGPLVNVDLSVGIADCNDINAPIDSGVHVLQRSLSFFDGLGIIVGIIIGSGIFSSPGLALERSGSPGACLLAW